jgi:hypothetical protein
MKTDRTNISLRQKEQIAELIAKMLSLSLGLTIIPPDNSFVNLYVEFISGIDGENPMKELLLLNRTTAEQLVNFKPEPHTYLELYEDTEGKYKSDPSRFERI